MAPAATRDSVTAVRSVNRAMRVVVVLIPCFVFIVIGYVLYDVIDHILLNQFLHQYHSSHFAIGFLVFYAVFTTATVVSYLRILITIRLRPGVVPLGHANRGKAKSRSPSQRLDNGRHLFSSVGPQESRTDAASLEEGPLDLESDISQRHHKAAEDHGVRASAVPPTASNNGSPFYANAVQPHPDPNNPSLELFYSKDVFECTPDGRPNWCDACGTWKPDRTHHSSEINRCVRKMEHFCPWVGGIISETTFKFFVQFNIYASILCASTIGLGCYAQVKRHALGHGADARIIVALALSGFFGFFAFSMACTCTYFVFTNLTSVESHQLRSRIRTMAVRIQRDSLPVQGLYNVITYPLPSAQDPGGYKTREAATGIGTPSVKRKAADPEPPLQQGALVRQENQLASGKQSHMDGIGSTDSRWGPKVTLQQGKQLNDEEDPIQIARSARAARREARDRMAYRTFAIIEIDRGTNVWDLGWRQNWTSVMGSNVLEWLLPFRNSPCSRHESNQSFYALGPGFRRICRQHSLPACTETRDPPLW